MTTEERLYTLNAVYDEALKRGMIRNKGEFAELLGVNRSGLSCAMNGNDKYLTESLVAKAVSVVRPEAIMIPEPDDKDYLPVIPIEAMAGGLGEFELAAQSYECERMISPIKGADYAMKVCGESMSPEYPNGSTILIKRINEKAFIAWNNVYVLDTVNGAVVKQVRRTDKEGVVECVSLNPDFQSFEIDTQYINGWYRVLAVLSLK